MITPQEMFWKIGDNPNKLPYNSQIEHPFSYILNTIVANTIWGLRGNVMTSGVENLPKDGPYALMPKHSDLLDIPVVGKSLLDFTGNTAAFLFKKELSEVEFKSIRLGPIIKWWFERCGAIMYDRHATVEQQPEVAQKIGKVMLRGGIFISFIEGTRVRGGVLGKTDKGIAMLAVQHGVILIPTGVSGTEEREGIYTVHFGEGLNQERVQIDRSSDNRAFVKAARRIANGIDPGMQDALEKARARRGEELKKRNQQLVVVGRH
ncbi:1-acyl-sn-glycerol-3-phosphate acyltransferase [Candidatus Saccharibacteria bacterium]|nr:1-acyl-sn-glycerol-3-phosphate acyltransferase [Candidatus Saccharibacteria bacterium]